MSDIYNPKSGGSQYTSVDSVKEISLPQSDISRVLPRQLSTGTTRGTQTVGYGNTKIDGTKNSITVGGNILIDGNNAVISVTSEDKSTIGMGSIPNQPGKFGFYAQDSNGNVIMTIVNGTLIMNDTQNDRVLLGRQVGGF